MTNPLTNEELQVLVCELVTRLCVAIRPSTLMTARLNDINAVRTMIDEALRDRVADIPAWERYVAPPSTTSTKRMFPEGGASQSPSRTNFLIGDSQLATQEAIASSSSQSTITIGPRIWRSEEDAIRQRLFIAGTPVLPVYSR